MKIKTRDFKILMQTVADAWNNKDPHKAVGCFSPDAVYMEPPDKQLVVGQKNLLEYFGGDNPKEMRLTWHNLMFDEENQIGSGEFTFRMEGRQGNHGMIVAELQDGRIKFWREYYQISDLDFKDFISIGNKSFKYKLE